jgi:pSer/pThr/pTyr-binding forkhead associated (FHA) protein
MDKTIPPTFTNEAETVMAYGVADTVGPQKTLTHRDVLNEPSQLTPSFYVCDKTVVRQIEIPPDETIFHIGKGKDNDIVLKDVSISDSQVAVVKVGNYVYFMDRGTQDCVYFNGVKKRQAIAPAESRMIMKIGHTWVVYIGIDCRNFDETDSIILKRSLFMNPPEVKSEAEILLKCDQGEWQSDSAPILVGSHSTCDYRIKGNTVKPFHFIVYFAQGGLFIEDLTAGSPGIKINNMNCIGARPVSEDVTILIDKLTIFLYVYGNIAERCETLFHDVNSKPNLAFSNLSNNDGAVGLPRTNERLSIGRSNDNNIIIPDPSVSRTHAHILIREKCLFIVDNDSHNKTYINLKPITKSTALPGDIVEFGDTPFLLHYDQ